MLDLLAFKATDIPAENKLVGAGFREGMEAWGGVSTGSELVDSEESGSGKILRVIDSPRVIYHYQDIDIPRDHKVFLKATVGVLDNSGLVGVVRADKGTFGRYYFRDIGVFDYRQVLTIGNGLRFGFQVSTNGSATFKDAMVIDLTEVFGAGNEPTIEQMDMLLEQFPNSWFDGTKNLFNAKEFMNTYHKKTKELENAIISLGGELP